MASAPDPLESIDEPRSASLRAIDEPRSASLHPIDSALSLRQYIRDIPDFPKPGIIFKDITPLLGDPQGLQQVLGLLEERVTALQPELIIGIESRGFVFGVPLADRLKLGFVPVRKPGKLPYRCVRDEYSLEYGSGILEMHEDSVCGRRVVIVDDLLATGGTAACTARLCRKQGATVAGFAFVIELSFLDGRKLIDREAQTAGAIEAPVTSLLTY